MHLQENMGYNKTKAKIPRGQTREHILEVAGRLFYTQGIRAIGVDTIVAQSGVAKTTLYDHFPSKDDLVKAYLEKNDHDFWEMFDTALQQHPDQPKKQLVDVFEHFSALIGTPESLGCPFISVASEFPELEQPGHPLAVAHKQKIRDRLSQLAQAAGAKQPTQLADQLLLLLDGAFASKRVFRSFDSPAAQLVAAANLLLDCHLNR
jgi:AcrR family transcriptional regulator